MKKLLALLLLLPTLAYAANVPPPGVPGNIITNNGNGQYGADAIGYGLGTTTTGGVTSLNVTITGGGGGSPGLPSGSLQYNNNGSLAGLLADTQAAYAAHDTVSNGLAYDPRNNANNPGNPAICHAPDVFTSDGHTQTYNYTTPFVGSSPTDNTNFYVYTITSGVATILNTSQFSVTGVLLPTSVGTGGGTITLNSAPSNGSYIVVLHDDTQGFVGTVALASASGGYISVPDNCWVQNMTWADGGNMIGQGFSPNYSYSPDYQKPVMHIISPPAHDPQFGINLGSPYIHDAFFEGFSLEAGDPNVAALANSQTVPVCIGTNAGAGGGGAPGVVAQYMNIRECVVGFGAPVGGSSSYIFGAGRFNNYSGNVHGTYGPLSDWKSINEDFVSNSTDGFHLGPQEGAAGTAGAAEISGLRAEFNGVGFVCDSCGLTNMEGIQIDGNGNCGMLMEGAWSNISVAGGWMRGNANGGFPNYAGNTASGQDAHLCFSGNSSSAGGFHMTGVNFATNYGEGSTAPLGSNNATTPPYVIDVTTTGSFNNNIQLENGEGFFGATTTGQNSAVTDFSIFRNGRPSNLKIDLNGQASQGGLTQGQTSGQVRGLPSNQWTAINIVGDASSNNDQYVPINRGWGGLVANQMGIGPTYNILNDFSHFSCDVVDQEIVPKILPTGGNNPISAWLPSPGDLVFGGGFFVQHEQDTNACRLGGLTWSTISQDKKVWAQSSNCTATGSWTNSSHYTTAYGLISSTSGDTLSCTTTTNGGPIYVWYDMNGSNGGTFTYQLDSGPVSSNVATQGNNQFTFPISSSSYSLGAIRVPVYTPPGSHTINIVITSTTTASNTVTIEGIGTPQKPPISSKAPAMVMGGYFPGTTGPAANNGSFGAFNNDTQQQAAQLVADGLQVPWANTALYFDYTNDYLPNTTINAQGQTHIAHAFGNVIQPVRNSENAINPIDFGASCNSIYFPGDDYTATDFSVVTTSGSPNIYIKNYTFQPGVATQFGGGDVGKRICLSDGGAGSDPGPCTYVLSVSTTSGGSSAVLGANVQETDPGASAKMGGYPKNPNDPSTAQDDSAFINAAGQAAILNGGSVFLPTNCMGVEINMPTNAWLHGNGTVPYYLQSNQGINATPVNATIFNCAFSGFPSDNQECIKANPFTRYSNFLVRGGTFPYTPRNMDAACIGYSSSSSSGPGAQISMDHMSFFGCPVDVGQAYGYNHPVSFLATVTPNGDGSTSTMDVLSITSTNFAQADNWTPTDFLALNRTVTASGGVLGSSTVTIIGVPKSGSTGNYTINQSLTVSTSTAMTAPVMAGGMELRDQFSQHLVAGLGYNGDFTDSMIEGSVCTGTFMNGCWRLGPNVEGYGNGANRWIGGRMEEQAYSAITCDGCTLTVTGLDSQFNGGYNLRTLGSGSAVQWTGGFMYGGGHCSGFGNNSVLLGGTSPYVEIDSVARTNQDFGSGCGGSTSNLFATATGASGVRAAVQGGTTQSGSDYTSLFNWANGNPTTYKQDVVGWPLMDNSQNILSASSTGGVGLGTATPTNGTALDLLSNTTTSNSSIGLPLHTTANRPTGVTGMFGLNTTTSTLEFYDQSAWNFLPYVTTAAPGVGSYLTSTIAGGTSLQWSNGPTLPNAMSGLTLSNDLATPNTIFDISPGYATSDDGTTGMLLSQQINKTTASWTVGSGNGCLDTGTSLSPSTWYYVFLIERTDTSVVDVACDSSLTSPTLPTNYTEKRFIGALETTTTPANIVSFKQYGTGSNVTISYSTPLADISTGLADTTSHLETLTVPPGLNVRPYGNYSMAGTSAILWSSPEVFPGAVSATNPFSAQPGFSELEITSSGYVNTNLPYLITNTSGQVALQATASTTTVAENTFGYQVDLTQRVPLNPSVNISFLNGTLPTGVTLSRTTTGWYFNSSGNLTAAAPNVARFDYGTPGSSTIVGLLTEGASTNLALNSRDLTQAAWTPTNATIALDQTGIDGVATSASSITATSNGATVCQTVTHNQQETEFSVYMKRISGTGTISIANDGSTYTTTVLSGSWQRFSKNQASVTNPQICIQLATNGDKIAVDVAQLEIMTGLHVFASSPIVTTTTSVARAADIVTMPITFNANSGSYVYSFEQATGNGAVFNDFSLSGNNYPININNGTATLAGSAGFSVSGSYNTVWNMGASYSSPAGVFATVFNGASKGAGSALASTSTSVTFGGNLYSWARNFEYWPYDLSLSQLQAVAPSP